MGASLSEPVTKRSTESCSNELYKVGSSSMQGWRISMEDAHTQILSMPEDEELSFFGVYDGHGGSAVARYASCHLHKRIVHSKAYEEGRIEDAIRDGYLATDEEVFRDEDNAGSMAGTTAVVVMIKDNTVYCGNVGDSRAVISSEGWAKPLSFDHKPVNDSEINRIIAAGGWVEFNRVNGNLAMSRALGDFMYKRNEEKTVDEQIVTAVPDVTCWRLSNQDEFIVLACDGIWDVLSNQEVVDFCRERVALEKEPEIICEELLSRCLAPDCQMGGLGCDNMTVVLVCLLDRKPYKCLAEKCSRPRPVHPSAVDADTVSFGVHNASVSEVLTAENRDAEEAIFVLPAKDANVNLKQRTGEVVPASVVIGAERLANDDSCEAAATIGDDDAIECETEDGRKQ